ncbi:hypothetical protein B0T24DRAFT_598301 [Lasiosphaeria ovina]|uniref:Myb/SANT-like domain-containing protein n=1 Tax=Lasiosphaeria ovina TaxID=92902 RepID=A0AAE0JWF9_9PEZI|nr:hypothetical protein B0T24DRAFT_598301 [Lasiosphaeria ovina]
MPSLSSLLSPDPATQQQQQHVPAMAQPRPQPHHMNVMPSLYQQQHIPATATATAQPRHMNGMPSLSSLPWPDPATQQQHFPATAQPRPQPHHMNVMPSLYQQQHIPATAQPPPMNAMPWISSLPSPYPATPAARASSRSNPHQLRTHYPYTRWPKNVKLVIFQTLCDCIDQGYRPKLVFKSAAYRKVISEVARQTNMMIGFAQIRWILDGQKEKFRRWQKIGEFPGAGWDEALKQWVLEPAAWDELIKTDPKIRALRGCSLPWLDLSKKLWGGIPEPERRTAAQDSPSLSEGQHV